MNSALPSRLCPQAFGVARGAPAAVPYAQVAKTGDGLDRSLPDYVKLMPFSAYIAHGMRFGGGLPGEMDFRVAVAGDNDLTVKLLGLVKPDDPAAETTSR
jgi:hypothetical protein